MESYQTTYLASETPMTNRVEVRTEPSAELCVGLGLENPREHLFRGILLCDFGVEISLKTAPIVGSHFPIRSDANSTVYKRPVNQAASASSTDTSRIGR
jgi:hypothetical protein